ncbi:DUF6927 domain-containing protein [Agromyces sp. NPDC057679]|uniref:DUF6927 domain-containing protein n=1 Tax=Agromyces sp. NPDC057679 TaxID=3346207 RepID=UPI003670EF4A
MGSTGMYRTKGQTNREFFTAECLHTQHQEVLADVTRRIPGRGGEWSNVYYAAVRDNRTAEVFGLIVLFTRVPNPYADINIYYKALHENSGTTAEGVTQEIIDLLTPTEHEFALKWRQDALASIARDNAKPKVKRGDQVKFPHKMRFTNGAEGDTFTFERGSIFTAIDGSRVHIPSWRMLAFALA